MFLTAVACVPQMQKGGSCRFPHHFLGFFVMRFGRERPSNRPSTGMEVTRKRISVDFTIVTIVKSIEILFLVTSIPVDGLLDV